MYKSRKICYPPLTPPRENKIRPNCSEAILVASSRDVALWRFYYQVSMTFLPKLLFLILPEELILPERP